MGQECSTNYLLEARQAQDADFAPSNHWKFAVATRLCPLLILEEAKVALDERAGSLCSQISTSLCSHAITRGLVLKSGECTYEIRSSGQ